MAHLLTYRTISQFSHTTSRFPLSPNSYALQKSTDIDGDWPTSLTGGGQVVSLGVEGPKRGERGYLTCGKMFVNEILTF